MAQDKAFLAMPYRAEYNWVRNAIAAACRRLHIDLVSVDEQVAAGDIMAAIHHHVRASDFGYVVLTGLNPNVMYEMGLLHQAAKPTIILADSDTIFPFDVRTLMVLPYDGKSQDEARLTDQVAAATGQLLLFFDHAERTAIAGGKQRPPAQIASQIGEPKFRMAEFDFDDIKNRAARAVGRKSCTTVNILVVDEADFHGWRVKARCSGGATLTVRVDLNGEASEIDVQE